MWSKSAILIFSLIVLVHLSQEYGQDYGDYDYRLPYRPSYRSRYRGRPSRYGGRRRIRNYKPVVPFDEVFGIGILKDKSKDSDYGFII